MRHVEHVLLVRKLDLESADHVLAELSEPLRAEVSLARCKTFLLNPKFNEISTCRMATALAAPARLAARSPMRRPWTALMRRTIRSLNHLSPLRRHDPFVRPQLATARRHRS